MQRVLADVLATEMYILWLISVAFIALYTVLARWWRSAIGRSLVMLDGAVMLAITPGLFSLAFGADPRTTGFTLLGAGALAMAIAAVAVRVRVLWRRQHDHFPPMGQGSPESAGREGA